MILAREPFGKFPHIAENGLVGPIRRYHRILARHFRVFCGKCSQSKNRHALIVTSAPAIGPAAALARLPNRRPGASRLGPLQLQLLEHAIDHRDVQIDKDNYSFGVGEQILDRITGIR
jgi:hypothetical protein